MATSAHLERIVAGLQAGDVVPYLGPGVLADVTDAATGRPIPADGEPLMLALNGGKPLPPKVMTEFPRSAMYLELKRGRAFLDGFLTKLYRDTRWTGGALHEWLASLPLPYAIDTNRDPLLVDRYAGRPHTLVVGVARITASPNRFRIWANDGTAYREIEPGDIDVSRPVLFKPLGTPRPVPTFVASDADFVDYITELMGGYAIPKPLKPWRVGRRYVALGVRFTRDTPRMIFTDVIADAAEPAGWALIPNATEKERRYCGKKGIEVVDASTEQLLEAAGCGVAR
jgi:hypothetical protein